MSQYNFIKRFGNFYSGFLNVSSLPLRLMSTVGILVALGGSLYALTVIWAYLVHRRLLKGGHQS